MIADEMRLKLAVLCPQNLDIIDESENHRGHSGWRDGGQTHYRIRMTSPQFVDLSRIQRHRLVHQTLGDLVGRIHALALELSES